MQLLVIYLLFLLAGFVSFISPSMLHIFGEFAFEFLLRIYKNLFGMEDGYVAVVKNLPHGYDHLPGRAVCGFPCLHRMMIVSN